MPKDKTEYFKAKDAATAQRTLFFTCCPDTTSQQHLEAHYSSLGPNCIESVRWGRRRDDSFAGFIHVVFKTRDLAKEALHMKPPTIFGRQLVVKPVEDRSEAKKPSKTKSLSKKEPDSVPKLPPADSPPSVCIRDFKSKLQYAKRSPAAIEEYRSSHKIQVNADCPCPVLEFNEVSFGTGIDKLLKEKYQQPTPSQAQTWPVLLSGYDCISLAKTGSGKTLAYLLPGMVHVMAQVGNEPRMLVLTPTRELTFQIATEAEQYALVCQLRLGLAFGGLDGTGDRIMQTRVLRRGVDVVIGTPGRVAQFVESDVLHLKGVSYVVVDEADQMLDQGFAPQIKGIISGVRSDRQTCLFSATWGKGIDDLAQAILTNPVQITVDHADALSGNSDVRQHIWCFADEAQRDKLCMKAVKEIKAAHPECSRTIIFVNAKTKVEKLMQCLTIIWEDVYAIHGDYQQSDREASLRALRRDPHAILVATDVAARGLDIDDLAAVINYNMPQAMEKYIHRIGRTGRAGKQGNAYTLFNTNRDWKFASNLVKVMESCGQKPPEELQQLVGYT